MKTILLSLLIACDDKVSTVDTAGELPSDPSGYVSCEMEYLSGQSEVPIDLTSSMYNHGTGWWCDTGELYSVPATIYCMEDREATPEGEVVTTWTVQDDASITWYQVELDGEIINNYIYLGANNDPNRCVAYLWEE